MNKTAAVILLFMGALSACSRDSSNFKLQCYGEHSLSKNNALVESKEVTRKYEFANKSIPEHQCTAVDKTIQCSKITDNGKVNINHYLVFNRNLETIYETLITTTELAKGTEKIKEIYQGKCQSPIF